MQRNPNPEGSVKDRPALHMIRCVLERGDISRDTALIEATSGITGIGMALAASVFGIRIGLLIAVNCVPV